MREEQPLALGDQTPRNQAALSLACAAGVVMVYQILPGDAMGQDLLRTGIAATLGCLALAAARWEDRAGRGRVFGTGQDSAPLSTYTEKPAGAPTAAPSQPRGSIEGAFEDTPPSADDFMEGASHATVASCVGVVVAALAGVCASFVLGTAASATGAWSASGGPGISGALPARMGMVLLWCLLTALWEETVFRALIPNALVRLLAQPCSGRILDPPLAAALLSSLVFALLHGRAPGMDGVTGMLRIAEAFCFAMALCSIAGSVAGHRHLPAAIATHALYDFVCFAPAVLEGTAGAEMHAFLGMPTESLTGVALDPAFILVATACLAPQAYAAWCRPRKR